MTTVRLPFPRRGAARGQDAAAAPHEPVCRAPFTSLHLDTLGDVRPCCQSTYVLGNVEQQPLDEIWEGDRAQDLRRAIAADDLSLGCGYCEWAMEAGDPAAAYARRYDDDELPTSGHGPSRIEIAPSNTCNLRCTMCNGEWSSSIRSQREGLPPLARRYGDEFFDDLVPWLPGLRQVDVFGGEPFLARDSLRLLELLADEAPHVTGLVTTNGTIWNDRVERLLRELRLSVTVSVDGATKQTYESIRLGASWELVRENVQRFHQACRASGASFSLTHCLMVENWWELPLMFRWAASLGVPLYVNTVTSPPASSLHHLSSPELGHVVSALGVHEDEVLALGDPWASLWQREVARLQTSLDDQREQRTHTHVGAVDSDPPPQLSESAARWEGARRLRFEVDEHLLIRNVTTLSDRDDLPEVDHAGLVGRPSSSLAADGRIEVGRSLRSRDDGRFTTEAVHRSDGALVAERRWVADEVPLRHVEVAQLPVLSEEELRAAAHGGAPPRPVVVEMLVDGATRLTELLPSVAAADEAGFALSLGQICSSYEDLLPPEALDPSPARTVHHLDPITTVTSLRWPDGREVRVIARERFDGSAAKGAKVFLAARPAPDAPSPRAAD